MRYDYLLQMVAELKPTRILEVGVWNGQRAKQMLALVPTATYYGFDLFEDATEATDAAEKNVKAHHSLAAVQALLADYDARLYKGNSRQTLAAFNEQVDFVWLDGGHSLETIASDWQNVRRCLMPGAAVFFDDYYTGGPDVGLVGCNLVVEDLKHELIPARDKVTGGGYTQIVRVYP